MPVLPLSSASNYDIFAGSAASGSVPAPITVDADAPDVGAVACLMWNGGVDATDADFGINFGSTPMEAAGDPLPMGGNHLYIMQPFRLLSPPAGDHNVTATYSGMDTELITRQLKIVVATYSGVESISDPTVVSTGTVTNNSVTITSVAEAYRGVFIHGCNGVNHFTSYNKIKRANQVSPLNLAGQLLLGDTPGAASITSTAVQSSTPTWAAYGFNLVPAIVNIDASMVFSPMQMTPNAGILRIATPSPQRFWEIPNEPDTFPPGFEGVTTDPGGCGCR